MCCCFGVCGVRARKPAAVSRDVVLPDSIPAQPATKRAAAAAAKTRMMFDLVIFVFMGCFDSGLNSEIFRALSGSSEKRVRKLFDVPVGGGEQPHSRQHRWIVAASHTSAHFLPLYVDQVGCLLNCQGGDSNP